MVDIDQEVDQASKEEKHGGVEKGGECVDSTRKAKPLYSFFEEGSYASPFVRGIPTPGDLKISAHPLLHERC